MNIAYLTKHHRIAGKVSIVGDKNRLCIRIGAIGATTEAILMQARERKNGRYLMIKGVLLAWKLS
jgi:hypothetical protein